MKHNIIIDTVAYDMLNNHVDFAKNVSFKYAKSIRNEFYKSVSVLKEKPLQYPFLMTDSDLPFEYRRILIKKRYSIIYYVEENNVYIDYIFDTRMNNQRYFG